MKFKLLTFIAVLAASAAALTAFNSCNAQEKKENIMPNDKKFDCLLFFVRQHQRRCRSNPQ